jgi:hypothetical protein
MTQPSGNGDERAVRRQVRREKYGDFSWRRAGLGFVVAFAVGMALMLSVRALTSWDDAPIGGAAVGVGLAVAYATVGPPRQR